MIMKKINLMDLKILISKASMKSLLGQHICKNFTYQKLLGTSNEDKFIEKYFSKFFPWI